ncbi:MAG: hypothetical protein IPG50_11730 [Myxococcales bacterium]|nr:hypothetical protein [Myxococcales bacterium]
MQTVAGAPTALAVRGLAFDGSDLFVPMSFTSGLNAWQIAATGRNSTPGADRRTIPAVGGIEGTVTAVFADRSGVYAAHVPIRGQKGPAWILERYCPDGSFHVELARGDGVVSPRPPTRRGSTSPSTNRAERRARHRTTSTRCRSSGRSSAGCADR